jgi:hypothetical protein
VNLEEFLVKAIEKADSMETNALISALEGLEFYGSKTFTD